MVADASALVDFVLQTERFDNVGGVIQASDADLHVPALCDVEAVAALRRALLVGALSESRANEALQDYQGLPLTHHDHQALLERMLELRNNFSTYDAVYVSLAERLGAALLTSDERLAQAARTHLSLPVLP